MPHNIRLLAILELTASDLKGLSQENQNQKIRQQWLTLSYKYHPDKNTDDPLATQRFQNITEAYESLIKKKERGEKYFSEIHNYFISKDVTIPETAFDLLLQENIETAYNELKLSFLELRTENEKKAFGAQYTNFLNLAQSLEDVQDVLNSKRVNYLFKQENETLKTNFIREWRALIIRLFAEEYLDDFQYRHALATGDLYPILATRKLLSPIKIMVAVLNSISLIICSSGDYLSKVLLGRVLADFSHQFNAYKSGKLSVLKASVVALKIIGTALLFCSPMYFVPTITFSAMGLPMIAATLELLASPVNKLIRPIAAYTKFPTFGITAFISILGAAALYAMISTTMLASALILMQYASLALRFYCLYGLAKLIHNMYKLSPALGIFQGLFCASTMLISMLISTPSTGLDPNLPVNIIANFFSILSANSIVYWGNILLQQTNVALAKKMEVLPLPEEEVPDYIKKATLEGNKKATQSQRFFNTPKEAEYLKKEDRTFSQQTASFFGKGAKRLVGITPLVELRPHVLAIQNRSSADRENCHFAP